MNEVLLKQEGLISDKELVDDYESEEILQEQNDDSSLEVILLVFPILAFYVVLYLTASTSISSNRSFNIKQPNYRKNSQRNIPGIPYEQILIIVNNCMNDIVADPRVEILFYP